MHIEKPLHAHSAGSVAQADIRHFYDSLGPVLVYNWLVEQGADMGLAIGFLRVQALPSVSLTVGTEICHFKGRTRGTLRGTRTAVAAERVPC